MRWPHRNPALAEAVTMPMDIAPASAASRVLNTIELLELILLELDMQTLLLHQRVNRTWNSLIQRSVPLQKKLWFIPDENIRSGRHGFNLFLSEKIRDAGVRQLDFVLSRQYNDVISDPKPALVACISFEKWMHKPNATTGSWKRMLLYQSRTEPMHWESNISCEPPTHIYSKQGCLYKNRPTQFYEPKLLTELPTMGHLLDCAIEKRERWLKARTEQSVTERIHKDKIGRTRFVFTSDFRVTVAIGAAVVVLSPVLIPLALYCRGEKFMKGCIRKKAHGST